MGDGGQVQHRVRRAAERHIDRLGVVEGGGRHDIARTDILLDELHDLHARVLGKAQARGVDGGDGAVAAQRHANGLGQAVHGVGGVHARAAAAGGAGVFRIVEDACLIELPGVIGADGLEHVAQAGAAAVRKTAREHRPARDKDRRDVEPRRGHQQAGDVFVAVGDHDQTVELVGHDHGFGGVGDQVAGDEGILHADVPHGDAVAHGDGREHDGRAARGADTGLDGLGDLVEVHVAGDNLVIRADHADQRARQLLVRIAQGIQKAAVRRALHAGFDLLRTHGFLLSCGPWGRCILSWRQCRGPCRRPRSCCGAAPRRRSPSDAWPAGHAWS